MSLSLLGVAYPFFFFKYIYIYIYIFFYHFLLLWLTVGTRTVGIISKIDQAATEPKALAAVRALLLNQGPTKTSDIPWVALIGQSVSIASAQSGSGGSENSLETAWRAESESLKSILTGAPQSKLGRVALVEALAGQIRNRMKLRLPNLLSGLVFFSSSSSILDIWFPIKLLALLKKKFSKTFLSFLFCHCCRYFCMVNLLLLLIDTFPFMEHNRKCCAIIDNG
jgi:hypothetical protein